MTTTATDMDAVEISEFLGTQGTGVLSLADGDDSYAVPVSFAFDDEDERGPYVYLRLGFAPGSEKRAFIDSSDRVSFVVYDDTEDGWKSVVARGRLETVSARSLDAIVGEAIRGLDIPYFTVHGEAAKDLNFTLARIDVTELTGIVEGTADP
jgi:hypothetical protein